MTGRTMSRLPGPQPDPRDPPPRQTITGTVKELAALLRQVHVRAERISAVIGPGCKVQGAGEEGSNGAHGEPTLLDTLDDCRELAEAAATALAFAEESLGA